MRQVCAWCGTTIEAEDGGEPGDSHGICPSCMQTLVDDDGTSLQSLIEQLAVPVLVVDDDVGVVTGNTAAQNALGKSVISIRGYRSGAVIGCEQAALPGGCGRQEQCRACVIRNSVNHTYTTGKPVQGAVAVQTVWKDGERVDVRFRITTAMRGGTVLLFVEDVRPLPRPA